MPSVSNSKVEKQPSLDGQEPQSKVQLLIENKIRNLEKRKSRLEQLEEERKSGRELNQDQRKAIKKYDEVVEMLEFFKEFKKNVHSIFAEFNKQMKEELKKEKRQRHLNEVERIRSIILFQDVLFSLTRETTRNDFLSGSNGAIQLKPEKLNHLDELYKMVHPDRTRTDVAFTTQISKAAEKYVSLVEGRKAGEPVKGITYEELKETLVAINECGYLDTMAKKVSSTQSTACSTANKAASLKIAANVASATSQQTTDPLATLPRVSDSQPIANVNRSNATNYENTKHPQQQVPLHQTSTVISNELHTSRNNEIKSGGVKQYAQSKLRGSNSNQPNVNEMSSVGAAGQTSAQSGYNFLQESRLEGTPHMDPAVVAMAPAPYSAGYGGNQVQSVEALAAQLSGMPMTSSSNMSKGVTTYDNTGTHQPIPTQTFTNQRFTAMMASGAFVQPVHPSMVPGSSLSFPGLAVPMPGQTAMMSDNHQQPQHQQQQLGGGMSEHNTGGPNQGASMLGGLPSQNMNAYESEATFTQFQAPTDNRGNQAPSREKQNFHDDNSGFGGHYGQYRRNNRGGGSNRGPGNQGGARPGNRSYHPMNGYNSRSSGRSGGPGLGSLGKPNKSKPTNQDMRNMAPNMSWNA